MWTRIDPLEKNGEKVEKKRETAGGLLLSNKRIVVVWVKRVLEHQHNIFHR